MSDAENIAVWSTEPLHAGVKQALQRIADSEDVVRVAVMPDVHLAEDVCVGTVVATTRLLYPSAVGGDIGCGMAAVRLTATEIDLDRSDVAAKILAGFERRIPILAHRSEQEMPERLLGALAAETLEKEARRSTPRQLGTLGRGNHFVEVQLDEEGDAWITVHSGSRGIGQAIRDHYLARADRSSTGLGHLDAETPEGRAYLADMTWALAFADENRRRILDEAVDVVCPAAKADVIHESRFACEHNHVVRVVDDERALWVHRKGAIAATEGAPGIIPGSMGDATYHVVGRGNAASLWSSSHGAGRTMSRAEARRRIRIADLERDVRGVWFDHRKLRKLVDEAPAAYKDISKVMRAQKDLVRIVRKMRPLISYKGV